MSSVPFFYTELMQQYNMGPSHPMKPQRLKMVKELLNDYGMFNAQLELTEPTPAGLADVRAIHSPEYIDALQACESGSPAVDVRRFGLTTADNPLFRGIFSASMLYTGASQDAAQAVMDGAPAAINISGGLHHAHESRAAGFCVLNDCAAAINRLKKKYHRVAYVDIDVHHGDGVQELFYSNPSVLTISIHENGRTLYPGTGSPSEIGTGEGEGTCVNINIAAKSTDEIWLGAWRAAAIPVLRDYNPEAIVLQMGADAHALDPLANLRLTAQGWLHAVQDIISQGKPLVVLGGGGYNLATVTRMWALASALVAGTRLDDAVPANSSFLQYDSTLLDTSDYLPDYLEFEYASARTVAFTTELERNLQGYYHIGRGSQNRIA